jgi:hypothetical protein
MRFGSLSCLLLAIASVGALFLALVAAAFSLNLAGMKRFDPTNIIAIVLLLGLAIPGALFVLLFLLLLILRPNFH